MSNAYYDDFKKEDMYHTMYRFLEYNDEDISSLLRIVSDVVSSYEAKLYDKYREQLEKEYKGYKEKVEQMENLINGH